MHKTIKTTLFGENELSSKYFKYLQELTHQTNGTNHLEIILETNLDTYKISVQLINNWLDYGNDENDNYNEDNCICNIYDFNAPSSTKLFFEQTDYTMITEWPEYCKVVIDDKETWCGGCCRSYMYQVIHDHNSNKKPYFSIYDTSRDHIIPELYAHAIPKQNDDDYEDNYNNLNNYKGKILFNLEKQSNILKPLIKLIRLSENITDEIVINQVY